MQSRGADGQETRKTVFDFKGRPVGCPHDQDVRCDGEIQKRTVGYGKSCSRAARRDRYSATAVDRHRQRSSGAVPEETAILPLPLTVAPFAVAPSKIVNQPPEETVVLAAVPPGET